MSDVGGDPACWLGAVCEACGAFIGDGDDHECPHDEPPPADSDVAAGTRLPENTG